MRETGGKRERGREREKERKREREKQQHNTIDMKRQQRTRNSSSHSNSSRDNENCNGHAKKCRRIVRELDVIVGAPITRQHYHESDGIGEASYPPETHGEIQEHNYPYATRKGFRSAEGAREGSAVNELILIQYPLKGRGESYELFPPAEKTEMGDLIEDFPQVNLKEEDEMIRDRVQRSHSRLQTTTAPRSPCGLSGDVHNNDDEGLECQSDVNNRVSTTKARIKPHSGRLEFHVDLNIGQSQNFDKRMRDRSSMGPIASSTASSNTKLKQKGKAPAAKAHAYRTLNKDKLVLRSTVTGLRPLDTPYAIGCMSEDQKSLVLVPLDRVVPMMPSFDHIDSVDNRAKESNSSQDAKFTDALEVSAPQSLLVDGVMPLQVQIRKRETEKQAELRLHSHAHLREREDKESWIDLLSAPPNSKQSSCIIRNIRRGCDVESNGVRGKDLKENNYRTSYNSYPNNLVTLNSSEFLNTLLGRNNSST